MSCDIELGGYTESGADGAGLIVGRQKQSATTLALGARWLGQLGERIFGRAAQTELRVNAAEDLGDTRGEADVALRANAANVRRVQGTKIGRTALQAAAGISLPTGDHTQLYLHTVGELREQANNWNVTVGFRKSF